MPKEKTTTRKAAAKGKADGGKKKKGKPISIIDRQPLSLTDCQTRTCQSVVSRPTCSSPTNSVIRSAMRTQASSSVSPRHMHSSIDRD